MPTKATAGSVWETVPRGGGRYRLLRAWRPGLYGRRELRCPGPAPTAELGRPYSQNERARRGNGRLGQPGIRLPGAELLELPLLSCRGGRLTGDAPGVDDARVDPDLDGVVRGGPRAAERLKNGRTCWRPPHPQRHEEQGPSGRQAPRQDRHPPQAHDLLSDRTHGCLPQWIRIGDDHRPKHVPVWYPGLPAGIQPPRSDHSTRPAAEPAGTWPGAGFAKPGAAVAGGLVIIPATRGNGVLAVLLEVGQVRAARDRWGHQWPIRRKVIFSANLKRPRQWRGHPGQGRRLGDLNPGWAVDPNRISSVF